MRQHVKDSSRIHGIVTGGGVAPNIVPDYSSSCFYLRAPTEKYLRRIVAKFNDIAKGAGLMAGVKYKLTEGEDSYKAGLVVEALNREYTKIATELGIDRIMPKCEEIGSSDFGNVSQIAPGLHCYFSASDKECPLHSKQFQAEAGSQRALASMLKAAEAIANIGLKFIADESFRTEVQSEFRKNLENFS
jgi:metal-dependent amidase/aminoacylase/carboxypeptidase family protein